MAAGSFAEYRSGQIGLGLEASFSSSSGEGQSPDIVALRRDSSSTTDEGMSNLDDDSSDAHSLTSRGDSPETIGHETDPRRVVGGGGEWSVTSSSVGSATTTATAVTSAHTSSDSTRHKRTLSEEDSSKAGQGQLLRKACDLCTKVRPAPLSPRRHTGSAKATAAFVHIVARAVVFGVWARTSRKNVHPDEISPPPPSCTLGV